MLSQVLESERLLLRPVTVSDAMSLLEGILPAGLLFDESYPGEFSLEVMDLLAGERKDESILFTPFFILLKSDNRVIGEIGYSCPEGIAKPKVGYAIVQPRWGQGYATEALITLLSALLAVDGVDAVQADTFVSHVASRRVMEKAGMVFIGETTGVENGVTVNLVLYEKLFGAGHTAS